MEAPGFTERKKSSQSASSGYYVGQDRGVGYVIYVDNTGKHGLIASKKYAQVSAVYQFGWIGGGGSYNWRACTGSELKTIYNVVGSKYPKQWFLSSDKNPNSVLKNKPDRFGVNFRNGQAMYITGTNTGPYYTIAVAEF